MVAVCGKRYHGSAEDTQTAWRHLPLLEVDDLETVLPHGCVGVAVDLIEGAIELPRYVHPEGAFYVFGGEDRTLGENVLRWCRDRVCVPTRFCMNLAATVNVVLYDRLAKSRSWHEQGSA